MGNLNTLLQPVGAGNVDLDERISLDFARSQDDTLKHILGQLMIMNKHLAIMTGENITEEDIEEHDL